MSKARVEKKALPKRFYVAVEVRSQAAALSIALDSKLLRTQGRNPLQIASAALAAAIAAEWDAQLQHIDPDTMPLTRLANLAIDRAKMDREAWLEEITRYGETDLLCYRAPAETGPLRARQNAVFTPVLQWLQQTYGIALVVTEGIMPVPQVPQHLEKLRSIFAVADDHTLAALAMLVPLVGSAVLALALWEKRITVEELLIACRLDEYAQAEQWGEDAEAAASWANKRRDIEAASFYLTETKKIANNS